MAISLKHSFQSAKADGPDSTQVQPSNWNAEHVLTLATQRLVGRTTAGTGAAEEISLGNGLMFSGSTLALATNPTVAGALTVSGNLTVSGSSQMTGAVGIGGAPAASAALDIQSTTKGVLFPRMTTAQRDAITSPATGLVIYNTTNAQLEIRGASSWGSLNYAAASQAEAEAGTSNTLLMTPLRTAQAIAAQRPQASQVEAEAGVENTKFMTPLRTAQAIVPGIIEHSRGLREVGEIYLPNAQTQLITGLTPGKQYRFVVNRTRCSVASARSLGMRASEDGGSSFRTGTVQISASTDWSSNILRGWIETGPRGNMETCFSAAAGANLYHVPMHVFSLSNVAIWSPACNAIEIGWDFGNFAPPASPTPDDNRIFIFEVQ